MPRPKVLFVASIPMHFHAFHRPYMKWFHDHGYEVHVACNGDFKDDSVSKSWAVPFQRSPWSLTHFSSCAKLRRIVEENEYSLVTCHTPMAGVLARLACLGARRRGTKVLYTAHGFHFFSGSGVASWLLYYPVELLLSRVTDGIVCINDEDFNLIRRKGSRNAAYYQIPGIGVDSSRFHPVSATERQDIRTSFEPSDDDFVVVYAAEFIERKNHRLIIDAVRMLVPDVPRLRVLFAGKGRLLEQTQAIVQRSGLGEHVRFLGFVTDVEKCYRAAVLVVSSSRQEGLGLNLVEAMMCGAPVVATVDRGHCTIIDNNVNGILVPQNDAPAFAEAIRALHADVSKRTALAQEAVKKASTFEIAHALAAMEKVYMEHIGGERDAAKAPPLT